MMRRAGAGRIDVGMGRAGSDLYMGSAIQAVKMGRASRDPYTGERSKR